MMAKQSIGDLVFFRNPKTTSIPESKKTVAIVDTYEGNAIFQWPATIMGASVVLKWDWMTTSDYDALRLKYMSTDEVVWVSRIGGKSFSVIVVDLNGDLYEHALDSIPFRKDVICTLSIRSQL